MKHLKLILIAFILATATSYAQNEDILKAINNQVWTPFTKAFETLDYKLFESLHSDDLVRVNGDGKRIQGKETYIAGYKERWTKTTRNQTIAFRFLERINNKDTASERGIYKLTINPNTEQEQSYYGKFHVILNKIDNVWKIMVDYDSSEKNTINNESFMSAFDINDYLKY